MKRFVKVGARDLPNHWIVGDTLVSLWVVNQPAPATASGWVSWLLLREGWTHSKFFAGHTKEKNQDQKPFLELFSSSSGGGIVMRDWQPVWATKCEQISLHILMFNSSISLCTVGALIDPHPVEIRNSHLGIVYLHINEIPNSGSQ